MMDSHRDELVELQTTTVAHGGVSIARLDGRVVFVADAVPGERVLARVTDDAKSSFWRADTVEVLDASPDRVPHVWSAASLDRAPGERAGGAEFGHIALPRQRSLKAEVLQDALRRFGGIDRVVEVEAIGDGARAQTGTGWRTRVRLQVDSEGRVGPYAARTHHVVPVEDHPLATPAIAAEAPLGRRLEGAAAVELLETSGGEVRMRRVAAKPAARSAAKPVTIVERVGEREFRVAEDGFWQVHADAARTLSEAVGDLAVDELFDPRASNLDLYGGVGLLAAALGDRYGQALRITSVESDSAATDHAAENLAEWVGAQAITARVDRYLAELERTAGVEERRRLARGSAVIDPPRSGAGRAVVESLARLGLAQVVYVACDPVAFARDAGTFREAGYELGRVRAFDLFPHTHHLEAVGVFTRSQESSPA
ncbi:class I SAM-dependent RNA methyltransferase [Herbiconiux moechotypicola]|uniref:TRAM domain-containing protein n=1 Tax=Herbiconiux moechotypicola TaxID=637393 RepID=A0ABN3DVS2_9MICO|nr:class I SAM-dependent RNA methyltransferase [Herbiconiux moechotypicola]MCS5730972.1 class I SAM-dependent RNA methyltransferase [Herbiconiux moechotypicola]